MHLLYELVDEAYTQQLGNKCTVISFEVTMQN